MRTATALKGQKLSDEAVKRKKPLYVGVPIYDIDGARITLEMQTNKEMTRGYKVRVVLESYGKRLSAVVDRDELIMLLQLEGK